jgi:peroxisomal membrane protein 4
MSKIPSTRSIKLHANWPLRHSSLLSALRGYRNGIISGVRIRLPYVIQALIYAALFRGSYKDRLIFVMKQMVQHGKNLGLFVGIYKSICFILRRFGLNGGLESWIAGFVGGFTAFGESRGLSGSVNNQIVLYLFARGLYGSIVSMVRRGYLPSILDVRSPFGFRVLAGFSLALILYLTEYEPDTLSPSFISTMNFLYYDSETKDQLLPEKRFVPFLIVVTLSLLGFFIPSLSLENILTKFLG